MNAFTIVPDPRLQYVADCHENHIILDAYPASLRAQASGPFPRTVAMPAERPRSAPSGPALEPAYSVLKICIGVGLMAFVGIVLVATGVVR